MDPNAFKYRDFSSAENSVTAIEEKLRQLEAERQTLLRRLEELRQRAAIPY